MTAAELIRRMTADPAEYRRHLRIDCNGTPRPLAEVADPFQRKDFEAIDPAWRSLAGLPGPEPRYRRLWAERHRGASKSQDAAVQALWLLAFSQRRVAGVAVAGDADQAAIIRNGIERLVALNTWLAEVVQVQRWKVANTRTGSEMAVLAADEQTSWGLLCDFAILDEVSAWPTDAMWISLLSAIGKKSNSVLLSILNAGFTGSWAHELREKIRQDPAWRFSCMTGHASWITEAQLAEQKRLLPGPAYRRLWENEWASGGGDALEEGDIRQAITLPGPSYARLEGHLHLIGLDAAVKKDHTAVVVVAAEPGSDRVKLVWAQEWRPPPGGEVDMTDVKITLRTLYRRYLAAGVWFDPTEVRGMAQELRREGMTLEEVPFTGPALNSMASTLLQCFRNRRIDLFDHPELVRDLGRLSIETKSYGYRLTAPRGTPGMGHCDVAVALSIVLPTAMEVAQHPPIYAGPEVAGNVFDRATRRECEFY